MDEKTTWYLVSGIIMAVSLIILVICWRIYVRRAEKRSRCSGVADGIVSQLIEDHDNDGSMWKPEFTYTVGGNEYTITSSVYSRPARYKVGDHIVVGYNPFDPSEAYVKGERGSRILLIAFTAAAIFDFIVGLVLVILTALGIFS